LTFTGAVKRLVAMVQQEEIKPVKPKLLTKADKLR